MTIKKLYKYQVWCNTENTYVIKWVETLATITACPNNNGHTIDTSKTQLLETHYGK